MITLIANIKGGVGKSTIAVNLATLRAKELSVKNKKLLLIDADRQGSSSNWANLRSKNNIMPKIYYQHSFDENIEGILEQSLDQYEEVIIDAGGADSISLRFAMVFADKLIIPLLSGQFEVWVLNKFKEYYAEAQKSRKLRKTKPLMATLLLNMQSNHPKSRLNKSLKEYLEYQAKEQKLPMGLLNRGLTHRTSFVESLAYGLAVHEMKKKDKLAVEQINNVYKEIWEN